MRKAARHPLAKEVGAVKATDGRDMPRAGGGIEIPHPLIGHKPHPLARGGKREGGVGTAERGRRRKPEGGGAAPVGKARAGGEKPPEAIGGTHRAVLGRVQIAVGSAGKVTRGTKPLLVAPGLRLRPLRDPGKGKEGIKAEGLPVFFILFKSDSTTEKSRRLGRLRPCRGVAGVIEDIHRNLKA